MNFILFTIIIQLNDGVFSCLLEYIATKTHPGKKLMIKIQKSNALRALIYIYIYVYSIMS